MKINKLEPTPLLKKFSELSAGDCFCFEGDYYTKTTHPEWSSFCLTDSGIYKSNPDSIVRVVTITATVDAVFK